MRRTAGVIAAVAVALTLTACIPENPGPGGLYLGKQADIRPVVTPRTAPVVWGSAAPIDADYGGTLYAGTTIEQADPRPALLPNGEEPLRLWMADPHDGRTNRPAIIWFHGGGFAVGIDSMYGLANGTAQEYAQRGYVGFSVEYRIDTTLVGVGSNGNRPPSLCQWVQDNVDESDPVWVARRDQCVHNIESARRDALAAVRYVRLNAERFGIDPNKVAVGGFSAGAVMAADTAYQWDDVGSHAYFPGDDLQPLRSHPQAAFGASGCEYSADGTPPTFIGAGDAPVSLIHSEYDQAVPYACAATTVALARSAGLVAELRSWCGEGGHAQNLYTAHEDEVDEIWTTFLARELHLYTGMRPPSTEPVCPGY